MMIEVNKRFIKLAFVLIGWLLEFNVLVAAEGRAASASTEDEKNQKNHSSNDDIKKNNHISNMNGIYVLSPTSIDNHDVNDKFPKQYSDYPTKETRYVDLYSPKISTLYSQVFWKQLDSVPLPDDLVKEYENGRGMAIIGFEVDQVIRREGEGEEDVSVPITVAYNHHFESTVLGKHTHLEEVYGDDPRLANQKHHWRHHGGSYETNKLYWIAVEEDSERPNDGDSDLPNFQELGAANGGEFRKSFHGFPPGYAKVVKSPKQFVITPMQIDTWNRDSVHYDAKSGQFVGRFTPGPLPRNALSPIVNSTYSGLLECPLTTRIKKIIDDLYALETGRQQVCSDDTEIKTLEDCTDAVGNITFGEPVPEQWSARAIEDATKPSGCYVEIISNDDDGVKTKGNVIFNQAPDSTVPCGGGDDDGHSNSVYTGHQKSIVDVHLEIKPKLQVVNITLIGPGDVWFGVGFDASRMGDEPWTITVEGGDAADTEISERKLGDQGSGGTMVPLPPSITVLSNQVDRNTKKRTVVITRPMKGIDDRYYTFHTNKTQLDFINAVGSTTQVSYHQQKTASTIIILPRNGLPICICKNRSPKFGSAKGKLQYVDEKQTSVVGFDNVCPPQPRSDLLVQKNPTCDIRTYTGGQRACHHMWSLLDADQDIPWNDQPLEYQLKFRIWYQDYDPNYHEHIYRTTWGIASPVEYDVPQCKQPKTKNHNGEAIDKECIHTITGTFDISRRKDGKSMKLVAAHFHCHAPTCLSVELYDVTDNNSGIEEKNDTHKLLCRQDAMYGKGNTDDARETTTLNSKRFDESDFIAMPPCLWGSSEYGLDEPPRVDGRTLRAIKTANSTYGHHGEMAWLQVLYTLEEEKEGDSKEIREYKKAQDKEEE